MNGRIFVSTTSRVRSQEWERIFGTDILPVLDARPRLQSIRNRPVMAFDLDLAALHQGQIARLAGHVSRKTRTPYPEALEMVRTAVAWPIEATEDVQITEAAEEVNTPTLPLFAPNQMRPPWLRMPHPRLLFHS